MKTLINSIYKQQSKKILKDHSPTQKDKDVLKSLTIRADKNQIKFNALVFQLLQSIDHVCPKDMLYKMTLNKICLYSILILVHNVYISTPRNICMQVKAKQTRSIRPKAVGYIKRSFEI